MKAWTDGFTIMSTRPVGRRGALRGVAPGGLPGGRLRGLGSPLGGLLHGFRGRRVRGLRGVPGALLPGRPVRLRVDLGAPQTAALAPRARDGARRAAEVGDDATRAAAGHTLPRLMGR